MKILFSHCFQVLRFKKKKKISLKIKTQNCSQSISLPAKSQLHCDSDCDTNCDTAPITRIVVLICHSLEPVISFNPGGAAHVI